MSITADIWPHPNQQGAMEHWWLIPATRKKKMPAKKSLLPCKAVLSSELQITHIVYVKLQAIFPANAIDCVSEAQQN